MEEKHNIATLKRPTGARTLDAALIPIDLLTYIKVIKKEEAYTKNGKNAITVFKTKQATVTVIALKAKENLHPGNSDGIGVMILELLNGKLHFESMGKHGLLKAGSLLTLNQHLSFNISAIRDSVCLLTIVK
jgi:hypothetical protein